MKQLLAILALCSLAACASAGTTKTASTNPLANLQKFTVKDLQNADAIAVANNDVLAHACYPALIKFVQSFPTSGSNTTVSGAVSAFEAARVTRIKVTGAITGGLPNYLKLGCAPLVMSEQTLLVKLGALGAGAAAVAPFAPLLATAP